MASRPLVSLAAFFVALTVWSCAATAVCRITPRGLIAERWTALDGEKGPLGCPVAGESSIEGPKLLPFEATSDAIAIASLNGRLFIAWKGAGNDNLNIMYSDDGITFVGKKTLSESSDAAPALAAHDGQLFLAWRGSGNPQLNVARVIVGAAAGSPVSGVDNKHVLGESSDTAPAITSHAGRLFLAWKGSGNDQINIASSADGGATFGGKKVLGDATDRAPALVSTGRSLLLAWKGSGNENINVAHVAINTAAAFPVQGLTGKVTLSETTTQAPALGMALNRVFLGWKGAGNDNLNMLVSADDGISFASKKVFGDASDHAPSLTFGNNQLWQGWKGSGNEGLNVAKVVLIGNTAGSFGIEGLAGRDTSAMQFEHGQIVTSPAQGPRMLIAAYQQDDNIVLNWGDTAPYNYDKFIVRWDRDGHNVGQSDVTDYIDRNMGFFRLQSPAPARYSLIVEGCDTDAGGSHCRQGWTLPVEVDYRLQPLPKYAGCDPATQPIGLIGERWAQLGGAEGPLGCAVAREHPVQGRRGAAQSFKNGEISWSPDQGEQMMLATYIQNGKLVATWGPTDPFHYDKFILRLDKNGQNTSQTDIGSGTSGNWSTPVVDPATYSVIVEGCDTDVGGSHCHQSWTIPASATVPQPPPPGPPGPPPGSACRTQPVGLIRDRWLKLGADVSPLGCPTAGEHDVAGRRGRVMPFANGQMVWSPDQGDAMVIAAYQQGSTIVVDWGDTGPFHYDKFIVRVDYEGENVGQQDADGSTSGTYTVKAQLPEDDYSVPTIGSGTGAYSIIVEGCDKGLGGSHCRQGWTVPVEVQYRTVGTGLDFSDLTTPRTVAQALHDKAERALRAAQQDAIFGSLDGDWGDDQTNIAIAMLHVIDSEVAAGKSPREHRRFLQRYSMLSEIEDAVRRQIIYAKSGTTADFPCKRTGEYDTAMKGYIPIIYRYAKYLAPDVRYRILHLLNQTGGHDPDLDHYCVIGVPETENHLWMIDSSRYLTNQLWATRSGDPKFDNVRNGLKEYLLQKFRYHLDHDFIEYNAKPYGRYTWMAIQNVFDYAQDPEVKLAAQILLDSMSAKAAVSTIDGRRNPPYRRRVSNNTADLLHQQTDRVKKRFLVYTGPTSVMSELSPANHVEEFATSEIYLAAATAYQPPDLILDLMVNPAHRSFYQRYNFTVSEVYAAEPDFLISAGSQAADYAYTVAGKGKDEDVGVAQQTTLIPADEVTTIEHMIRFKHAPSGPDAHDNTGLCVAPDFACGLQPIVPAMYQANQACVSVSGPWTFVDVLSPACREPGHAGSGFYAAVFGSGTEYGFLEAVPRGKLGAETLAGFAEKTLARNRGTAFNRQGLNRYAAWGGNEIQFDIDAADPIVATGIPDVDEAIHNEASRAASGTVVTAANGTVTIVNAGTGDKLAMSLADPRHPVRTLTPGHPATPPPPPIATPLGQMLALGVDFSVPERDLSEWLANSFTPYPSVVQVLGAIEAGHPLRNPVYIDVVVYHYEHTPGVRSPRSAADVDSNVLKAAVLAAAKDRYGEAPASFEALLQ